jgi:hypothetical protein
MLSYLTFQYKQKLQEYKTFVKRKEGEGALWSEWNGRETARFGPSLCLPTAGRLRVKKRARQNQPHMQNRHVEHPRYCPRHATKMDSSLSKLCRNDCE